MEVREAREPELDRLIEIHTSAFPDPRGYDARRTNFVANPLGPLGALYVVVDHGALVGHAFLFELDVWVNGAPVKCGAIATVGVAPEARGRGVASFLLSALHVRAITRGAAFTMLYPFRQAFYARHGYASVSPNRRLHLHPAAIPSAWRKHEGLVVRRADNDREAIEAAYAWAAARTTGWLVRPKALWDLRLGDERRTWLVAARGSSVVGYIAWSLVQSEPHASTRLVVRELCADDDAVRRALLGAVGAQRDQVVEVELEIDARDPLPHALLDADRARFGDTVVEHMLGHLVGGPMVRVTEVQRAIDARVPAGKPAFTLAVEGETYPIGDGVAWEVVETDRATLGALLFGGLSVAHASALGLLHASSPEAITRADAAFGHAPFFALDSF